MYGRCLQIIGSIYLVFGNTKAKQHIMEDKRVKLFSDFIKELRYNNEPRQTVKAIIKTTGLTRLTLLELENEKKNSITPYVSKAFKEGYKQVFENFEKEWIKTSQESEAAETELSQLIKTIAEISKSYSATVDKLLKLQDRCNQLEKELNDCLNSKRLTKI